jgi:hypothetical protein
MPITPFQSSVLKCIAVNRNPENYVAGATVINRKESTARISNDIDLFHDPEVIVQESFRIDQESLLSAGFTVETLIEQRGFIRAIAKKGLESVKLEWVSDSAFRFFPIVTDPLLGYRLHDIDAAINKCLALASRSEARDLIDILQIHRESLHLGAICYAACGKDPGFTPNIILGQISRNAKLTPELIEAENLVEKIDPVAIKKEFLLALKSAEQLIESLPAEFLGSVFVAADGSSPHIPDPTKHQPHYGTLKGAWPVLLAG